MASQDNNLLKRRRLDDSPDDISKNVDVCHHCNKKCTKKSEAVQCDLCYSWLHASCEGLSKEQYKLLTQLISTVDNVMYFCKLNKCETRSKQLMFNSINKTLFPTENIITDATAETLVSEQNALKKDISELSAKLNALCATNENLQKEIKSAALSIANMDSDVLALSNTQRAGSSNNAMDIIDEMADRDRRKNNIVVYNFAELADRNADIESFKALSNTNFKLDLDVVKAIRLGPKVPNKHRPLLLTVEDTDDKAYMLSHSHFLKRHEQYNNIILYIVPDRTRLERIKHKRVVEELKRRRANGETNLMIRNGSILQRQPRANVQATTTQQTTNTQQGTDSS